MGSSEDQSGTSGQSGLLGIPTGLAVAKNTLVGIWLGNSSTLFYSVTSSVPIPRVRQKDVHFLLGDLQGQLPPGQSDWHRLEEPDGVAPGWRGECVGSLWRDWVLSGSKRSYPWAPSPARHAKAHSSSCWSQQTQEDGGWGCLSLSYMPAGTVLSLCISPLWHERGKVLNYPREESR